MSMKNDKQPCARLCHIVKWEDFDGYGFNLHAERGKEGQFIGKVDDGSPSQAAGLRQGDRIIEVNEINIDNETHKQVVDRIKAFPNETKLLVVDQEADDYYKANNIIIKGTMSGIKVIKTPEKNPTSEHEAPDGSISSVEDNTHKSNHSNDTLSNSGSTGGVTATLDNESDHSKDEKINNNGQQKNGRSDIYDNEKSISNETGSNATEHPSTGNGNVSGTKEIPNLNMTAKEMRAKLAARKKKDPKKESIGIIEKFEIVKKL